MKMRFSTCLWLFLTFYVIHSITIVESKKLKEQNDINELSRISVQKNPQKVKKLNTYSITEKDVRGDSVERFKMKEKSRKKKEQLIDISLKDNDHGEVKTKKKYEKKKNNIISSKKVENIDSESCTELKQKRKNTKIMSDRNTGSETFSEVSLNRFQKKSIINEVQKRSQSIEEKLSIGNEKRRKQHSQQLNGFSGAYSIRRVQGESNVSERDATQPDGEHRNRGSSTSESSDEDECSDDATHSEAKQKEMFIEPKKIKYSTKFAHEKTSKKEKNKEAKNILKLHRKAETNQKTSKNSKRNNRFHDEDEDSSEEVLPRRQFKLYEEDDG